MAKKNVLGRGLGALIADAAEEPVTREIVVSAIQELNLADIRPNPFQPRTEFDEEALSELAASIKAIGIVQPITVRAVEEGKYEIIAGERRFRASKLAGLSTIPAYIRKTEDDSLLELALIENIQREDLNPIEEAQAYKRLLTEFHLKQDEIAERVGKSRTAVTNAMRLLKLSEKVQQMLIDEMITAGHARAILSIADKEKQESIAMKVFDEKLSVRETEKLVKNPEEEGVTLAYIRLTKDFEEIKEYVQHEMDEIALFLKRRKMMINQLWKDTMHMERVSLVMVT